VSTFYLIRIQFIISFHNNKDTSHFNKRQLIVAEKMLLNSLLSKEAL